MPTVPGRTHCVKCGKEKATLQCRGCLQDFCFNDFGNHRQELSQELDEVEVSRDLFRQTLSDQTTHPQKHSLIQQVNKWEHNSIKKIQKTAEEARQLLIKHTNENIVHIETRLNKLTDQLRQSRQENDFFETDLNHWKEDLKRLTKEILKPPNITLRRDSTPLVTRIYVEASSTQRYIPSIGAKTGWTQNGITVAGGNKQGNGLNQLNNPHGLYVDDDQTIYIADTKNHRIVEWKCGATTGKVVAGGTGRENQTNQLNRPTDVIVDERTDSLVICDNGNRRVILWSRQGGRSGQTVISDIDCYGLSMDTDGFLYISDCIKNEVRRWRVGETHGIVVAGGNGQGDRLDQLYFPSYVFVDRNQAVYVTDANNARVMKWVKGAKEGIVVSGGKGTGTALTQLSDPQGIAVDQRGTVYVADFMNNRVMRWPEGATQGDIIVGGHGKGEQANQLNGSNGLAFDRHGHLYVVEQNNHRVQKFQYLS